ncbi:MAG TPA: hypothetical protein VH815_00640, partial [Acidobacteriota bacterium]
MDDGTFQIDNAIKRFGGSQDMAFYKGHYYSDKAIGVSILGIPIFVVLKLIGIEPDPSVYL